ncbi:MAG: hypothetical protein HYX74_11895 [Acidobacteria bacterium]|nr:hypothetical protein [Acidobacteriota bacterium]
MSNAQRGLARVQAVDVRFVDLIGLWQHFTASTSACRPHSWEFALYFDV